MWLSRSKDNLKQHLIEKNVSLFIAANFEKQAFSLVKNVKKFFEHEYMSMSPPI